VISHRTKFKPADLAILTLLGCGFAWLIYRINTQFHYNWNWHVIPQYLFRYDPETAGWVPGLIMEGVFTTLRMSLWATILALIIGIVMGLFRTSRSRFQRMIGMCYVALIRNIPVLVWIFIFYYFISGQLIPLIGMDQLSGSVSGATRSVLSFFFATPERFPVFISGVIALAVYEGAYVTEIVRAGIQSIERGQWEASSSLGLTRRQQLRHIIFPQALQIVLPPLAGQFISTIKDSAIVSVISIQELTFQGMELMSATFLTFEVWITILTLYLVICLVCSLSIERVEVFMKRRTRAD